MDEQKELERIEAMLEEAQASLTNCQNTNDRKNEAQVIKELYAARRAIIESIVQINKNESDAKLKEEELKEQKAWHEQEIEEKRQSRKIEEDRLHIERERQKLDYKWRRYDYGFNVGKTITSAVLFFGSCAVAAVAANEGWYDQSVVRSAGMIPQEMAKGLIRR